MDIYIYTCFTRSHFPFCFLMILKYSISFSIFVSGFWVFREMSSI